VLTFSKRGADVTHEDTASPRGTAWLATCAIRHETRTRRGAAKLDLAGSNQVADRHCDGITAMALERAGCK
jgi:hypothetical protein